MEACSGFEKKYMCKYKVYETDDFFEMLRRGLMAKCAVMRKYTFLLVFSLCILVLSGLVGCRETEITDKSAIDDEKEYMKLYFNDTEIPVIWEDNQTVQELMEEAGKGDIVVQMSMYSDNEQVGSLGKMNIPEGDVTELLSNGDITLKIVIEK